MCTSIRREAERASLVRGYTTRRGIPRDLPCLISLLLNSELTNFQQTCYKMLADIAFPYVRGQFWLGSQPAKSPHCPPTPHISYTVPLLTHCIYQHQSQSSLLLYDATNRKGRCIEVSSLHFRHFHLEYACMECHSLQIYTTAGENTILACLSQALGSRKNCCLQIEAGTSSEFALHLIISASERNQSEIYEKIHDLNH